MAFVHLLSLGFCFSSEQVCKPLCLCEIQITLLKGSASELTRLSQSNPWHATQGIQNCPDHCWAPMHM